MLAAILDGREQVPKKAFPKPLQVFQLALNHIANGILWDRQHDEEQDKHQELMPLNITLHKKDPVPGLVKCFQGAFFTRGHGLLVIN